MALDQQRRTVPADSITGEDHGPIWTALPEDCKCSGRFLLDSLADLYTDCSGSIKSGNHRGEKASLAHHQSLAQPDS